MTCKQIAWSDPNCLTIKEATRLNRMGWEFRITSGNVSAFFVGFLESFNQSRKSFIQDLAEQNDIELLRKRGKLWPKS